MDGLILALTEHEVLLTGRTERSLCAAGIAVRGNPVRSLSELGARLALLDEPVLVMRSGTWLKATWSPETAIAHNGAQNPDCCLPRCAMMLPSSATGRSLVAFGVNRPWGDNAIGRDHAPLTKLRQRCGGDFQRLSWRWRTFPEPFSIYLEPAASQEMACALANGASLADAATRLVRSARFRVAHSARLDFHKDARLRILQLVTTIQIGGAERVALDLSEELNHGGNATVLAAFSSATRRSFAEPPLFCALSHVPNSSDARGDAVAAAAASIGADVIHGHLIRSSEARAIKRRGFPVILTVHNLPQSWPPGLGTPDAEKCDLILACSKAVEHALEHAEIGVPVRTVWNGIDARRVAPSAQLKEAGRNLRRDLGWSASDLVIVTVANPRAQKRLERLPHIVGLVSERLKGRQVRLLIAGAASVGNRDAEKAVRALHRELHVWLDADQVHWERASCDVAPLLHAADLFVSVSAFEGLSVAQLEALAAGLPVVTTPVGGAPEVARFSTSVFLLPPDASAVQVAETIVRVSLAERQRISALPPGFTRYVMTRRTASFYPPAIVRNRARYKNDTWLVTNNFSTGGAQTSARRLLIGMKEKGESVCAFTIQEQAHWPTFGRRALMQAGVRCVAIPPAANLDPNETVAKFMEYAASRPPRAVLFWNVIASHKVLLSDALLDTPIYDVSPGSMYFRALADYFATPRHGLPYFTTREYGKRLSAVIVKYRAEKQQAEEVLGTRVFVIPNGVPHRQPGRTRANDGRVVIGTAARISPDKKLEDLIDAIRIASPRLGPHVVRIAGGVERGQKAYARELRRRARGLSIEWLGEVVDVEPFYRSLDLFAMISEPAGCPNASLEAMAVGVPVVATDHGGASEQIVDRYNGRLIPRGDLAAFGEALAEMARESQLRTLYGHHACEHVRAHFSIEGMINSYRELCCEQASMPLLPRHKAAVDSQGADRCQIFGGETARASKNE